MEKSPIFLPCFYGKLEYHEQFLISYWDQDRSFTSELQNSKKHLKEHLIPLSLTGKTLRISGVYVDHENSYIPAQNCRAIFTVSKFLGVT